MYSTLVHSPCKRVNSPPFFFPDQISKRTLLLPLFSGKVLHNTRFDVKREEEERECLKRYIKVGTKVYRTSCPLSVHGANNFFGRNCQYYVEGICKRTGIDVLDLFLSLSFVW